MKDSVAVNVLQTSILKRDVDMREMGHWTALLLTHLFLLCFFFFFPPPRLNFYFYFLFLVSIFFYSLYYFYYTKLRINV